MSHLERRTREKEEIRQSIIAAARKIAVDEGWQAVTIRKIADMIEYTPPIVYEYFENKEDLFKELVYFGFRLLHKDLASVVQQENDPKAVINYLSVSHWDFAANNYDLYQLMFNLEKPVPNDEMMISIELMKNTFEKAAKGDQKEFELIILSWMCLTRGAISTLLMSPLPHFKGRDTRKMYLEIVQRFIDTLK